MNFLGHPFRRSFRNQVDRAWPSFLYMSVRSEPLNIRLMQWTHKCQAFSSAVRISASEKSKFHPESLHSQREIKKQIWHRLSAVSGTTFISMADGEVIDPKKYLEESCKPKCVKPLIEYG
ncbi:hypothetical protein SLE2022_329670 [Rubroshorea leprosula]